MLRPVAMLASALVLIAAAPGQDDSPALVIERGHSLAVRIDGTTVLATPAAADTIAPFEAAATNTLWQTGKYKVGSVGTGPGRDGVPPTPPIVPDQVKLKMVEYPKGETLLAVENGYSRAFVYHAQMIRDKDAMPTTVCLVIPGKRTIEHWPFQIRQLVLRDIHLTDWKPGDPMQCG
jgi:hypothetical protein